MSSIVSNPPLRLVLRLELYVLAIPATLGFFFGIFIIPGLYGSLGTAFILVYGFWMYAFWNLTLYWRDRRFSEIPHRVKFGLGIGYAFAFLSALFLLRRPFFEFESFLMLTPVVPCTHLLVLAWRAERAPHTSMQSPAPLHRTTSSRMAPSMRRKRPYLSLLLGAGTVMLVVAVGVAIVFIGDYRRKSMEPVHLTQCFKSFDFRFDRKDEFHKDNERRCYGQRWVIPAAYYSRKYIAYNSGVDALVMEVGRPDIIHGITEYTPGGLLPRDTPPLYKQVTIIPLVHEKFFRFSDRMKNDNASRLMNTGLLLFGMSVFDRLHNPEKFPRDVYLFVAGRNPPYFVKCLVKPDEPPEIIQTAPKGGCTVTSNIDDLVYLEYHVNQSELPRLPIINNELITLARSFMIH